MKKTTSAILLLFFLILTLSITILSINGIETNKFNNFISKKINQANSNINIELSTIKFKLDIKEISLYLETVNPKISYRGATVPTKNVKVYIDFISLIKSEAKIKKINLLLKQLDVDELKKISTSLKPSNFKSFINNKIQQGKINTEIDFYLNENNSLDNFIARGSVSNLKVTVKGNINLDKTNFSFFADKSDVLIKNIFSELGPFKIKDGDLKLKLSSEVSIESNFKSYLKYNSKFMNYQNLIKNFNYAKNITNLEADLNNTFKISFDKTYKIKEYDYNINGKILKTNLNFEKPLDNFLLEKKIDNISLINSEIKTNFNSKKNNININGRYIINNDDSLPFNLKNIIDGETLQLELDADYSNQFKLDAINYVKLKGSIANISLNLNKKKDNIKIKKLNITEGKDLILVENAEFNKNKFLSFKKILVKTTKAKKRNNNFSISYGKKISIKGNQFDASNLHSFFNEKNSKNNFSHISKDIEIDFDNIVVPLSENLKNFKLIGKIEKGKFIKILSKGNYNENNFLDITLKKDSKNQKKYLEIYSDLTSPLLAEYSFFKGLTGGKLLYSSIIDGENSNSKLKIENKCSRNG